MNYENMTDTELHKMLEKSVFAERFKKSDEFKLINEASKRIVERAIDEFALGDILPKDNDMTGFLARVIELRAIIRKYKYGIFNEIESFIQEGENAFYELKERNEELDPKTSNGNDPEKGD